MNEREVFEKYDNLSENELNTKSNKRVYVRNDNMTFIIKHCRKKMIPESEISECSDTTSNQKQETYLLMKKFEKNIELKFMKIIPVFMSIMRKK